MKRLLFITASILLVSYAASAGAATQPTPVAKPSITPLALNASNEVGNRLMNQWRLVAIDLKSGKITQAQAVSIRARLKSIHKQQAAFLRASANHQLTTAQQAQLNSQLDQNSQVLGESPTSN
jgi:hypothetical protein